MPTPKSSRTAAFARNPDLETFLAGFTDALAPAGDALAAQHERPAHPVVLVVGCPRSGSTLFMQWLAASSAFTVPGNLVARFHRAPAVGAMVERMLFDPALEFRGELALAPVADEWTSSLGKTRGPREPNEFWYFWRRHFPFAEGVAPTDDQLDGRAFLAELAAWEAVTGRPIAMKGLIANWILPWLARLLQDVVFVDLVRDPFFVVQSLLESRRRFSGDEHGWYSFKPPGWQAVADLDPVRQVAWQVTEIRRAVDGGLSQVPAHQRITVQYERFCSDPAPTWEALSDAAPPRTTFTASNKVRCSSAQAAAIRRALAQFA